MALETLQDVNNENNPQEEKSTAALFRSPESKNDENNSQEERTTSGRAEELERDGSQSGLYDC